MNKINGIDVSECEFLECGMCNAQRNCDGYTGIECKYDNESCYYRQLKRLQEEKEELKEKITKFKWDNPYYVLYNNVVGQRDNLKRENEKLKEKNKELLNLCNNGGVLLVTESAKTKKYKQALEEIREIAKYSIMHNSELNSNYQIILQNINEALNEQK